MASFADYTVVDLTLALGPDTVMWPGVHVAVVGELVVDVAGNSFE